MTKHWAIITLDGVEESWMTDGRNPVPGVDCARSAELPRAMEDWERWDWASDEIAPRLETLRARLLDEIDRAREAQRAKAMTPLIGQSYVYEQKASEVGDYYSLDDETLDGLSDTDLHARFPFAMAEADVTNDSLATVIARFADGLADSRPEIARVEALAMNAKLGVRTAETAAAMQAAADVDWEGGA